ncbi:hypothetical protein [Natronosalvus vescus]|uniref:hypothetical protein n=1 Tax=Natronosalvus vescus TaxID=2953881 RepID=UPI002090C72D|nr:hypothetical protein [Natronosalvus vescus]
MPEIYLLSTLVMGLLVLAVVYTMARMGQRATPSGHAGTRSGYAEWSPRTEAEDSRVVALAKTPAVWTLSFIALIAAFIAGAVLLVGEGEFVEAALVEPVLLAIGGLVLFGYIFFGTFFAARDRFGNTAIGVAFASLLVGFLGLIAVTVTLLMG